MARSVRVFLPALCLAAAGPAWAQDADSPFKCNPDGSQQEMNMCAYDEWQAADKELNRVYQDAVAFAKEEDAFFEDDLAMQGAEEALRNGQRAWVEYRDGNCDFFGFNTRGGSMEPLMVLSCKADLTQKRTRELKEIMVWPEELPSQEATAEQGSE